MSSAALVQVRGRSVWDSRGRPTVEAEVELASGHRGRAIAPAGASKGAAEAQELRDRGRAHDGLGVDQAVAAINEICASELLGLDVTDQDAVDRALVEINGTTDRAVLGANAMVALSMAVAHAGAAWSGTPLWRYVATDGAVRLPLPEVQIFGGGAHAQSRMDLQDVMVIPVGATSFAEAMAWSAEVYHAAGQMLAERGRLSGVADEGGWWPTFESNEDALASAVAAIEATGRAPGSDVALSLDVAASTFFRDGRYDLQLDQRTLDRDELTELLLAWCDRYPIRSVEDPLAESDHAGMATFTGAVGSGVQVVGDDFLVTDAARIRRGASAGACNAVLIKPNQEGTLSGARAAADAARSVGWGTIASARSGETEDVTIAHLAVGWNLGQLKVGAPARSERTAKWNEVLRIEEAFEAVGGYAGGGVLP